MRDSQHQLVQTVQASKFLHPAHFARCVLTTASLVPKHSAAFAGCLFGVPNCPSLELLAGSLGACGLGGTAPVPASQDLPSLTSTVSSLVKSLTPAGFRRSGVNNVASGPHPSALRVVRTGGRTGLSTPPRPPTLRTVYHRRCASQGRNRPFNSYLRFRSKKDALSTEDPN